MLANDGYFIFQAIVLDNGKVGTSLVMSPISTNILLAMLYQATSGNNKKELLDGLYLSKIDVSTPYGHFQKLPPVLFRWTAFSKFSQIYKKQKILRPDSSVIQTNRLLDFFSSTLSWSDYDLR